MHTTRQPIIHHQANVMERTAVLLLIALMSFVGCGPTTTGSTSMTSTPAWQSTLRSHLPLLGHRNWILVVDKAFPEQNAPGLVMIDTDAELLEVLDFTLAQIDSSTHVKPIVYCDAELPHITRDQVPEIDTFRAALGKSLHGVMPQVILHESVFQKIDEASKLFKVLVLKTNGTIAYSSVFLQLDCKYWSAEKEAALRQAMKGSGK